MGSDTKHVTRFSSTMLERKQTSLQLISNKTLSSHQNNVSGIIALQVSGKIYIYFIVGWIVPLNQRRPEVLFPFHLLPFLQVVSSLLQQLPHCQRGPWKDSTSVFSVLLIKYSNQYVFVSSLWGIHLAAKQNTCCRCKAVYKQKLKVGHPIPAHLWLASSWHGFSWKKINVHTYVKLMGPSDILYLYSKYIFDIWRSDLKVIIFMIVCVF